MTKQARKVIVDAMLMTKCLMDTNVPYAQVLEEQWTRGGLSGVTRYTYGDALVAQTTNGVSHFYQYDGLSSPRALTDAAGAVTDTYAYDAYGQLLEQSGASANPYLYRGEPYDPETDAYYLRARYYQPGIGRFLTTDPEEGISFNPMTQHRYVYGNDSPVNNIDPSGKLTLSEAVAVTAILNVTTGIAVQSNLMGLQDIYVSLAKNLLPDAYIVGIGGNLPMAITSRLHYLNHILPGSVRIPHLWHSNDILGYELLFSISSAEIALFKVKGINLIPLVIYYGAGFYEGAVWNLWNAKNYSGSFLSGGLFGVSVFFSPRRNFYGTVGNHKRLQLLCGTIYSKILRECNILCPSGRTI